MEELIDSVLHHSVCMDSKKKLVGFMNVKRKREENDSGESTSPSPSPSQSTSGRLIGPDRAISHYHAQPA